MSSNVEFRNESGLEFTYTPVEITTKFIKELT